MEAAPEPEDVLHQKKIVTAAAVILFFLAAGIWYRHQGSSDALLGKEYNDLSHDMESIVLTLTPTATQPPEEMEQDIFVFICGAVKTPGVYALPAGSRLYEAVYAAGGFLPEAETEYHNQARKIVDGERIYILSSEEASALTLQERTEGENVDAGEKTASGQKINLNTAGAEQLTELPGIGTARAESIIEYRKNVGKFQSVEEIMNISGIGQAMFDKIKDRIMVE